MDSGARRNAFVYSTSNLLRGPAPQNPSCWPNHEVQDPPSSLFRFQGQVSQNQFTQGFFQAAPGMLFIPRFPIVPQPVIFCTSKQILLELCLPVGPLVTQAKETNILGIDKNHLVNENIDENNNSSASFCSWCKLAFGALRRAKVCLKKEAAEICQLCQMRTSVTRSNILSVIGSDPRAQNYVAANILGQFTRNDEILGYLKDVIKCRLCWKEIPKRDMASHLIEVHEWETFSMCAQNCSEYIRCEEMKSHYAACRIKCEICAADSMQPFFTDHVLDTHREHVICSSVDCLRVFTDLKVMFDHFTQDHLWKKF